MIHGEEDVKPGLTKFPGKLQGLVMSKAGLVAAANWLLGPLSFKKQIHGMDCNGNGYVVFPGSFLIIKGLISDLSWSGYFSDLDQTSCRHDRQSPSGNQIIRVLSTTATTSSGKYSQSFCQQNIWWGIFPSKEIKFRLQNKY